MTHEISSAPQGRAKRDFPPDRRLPALPTGALALFLPRGSRHESARPTHSGFGLGLKWTAHRSSATGVHATDMQWKLRYWMIFGIEKAKGAAVFW